MWSYDDLHAIYARSTSVRGGCFHCGKKLVFKNHGQKGRCGAWEVDHGDPRSRGGTDLPSNLHASCIACNRKKSKKTTAEYRRRYQ